MTLAELTTMQVGGPARDLVRPTTEADLVAAARDAFDSGDDWLLLGGGSNIVIADDGFEGIVIHVATRGIERLPHDEGVRLRVQAGESWDALVSYTVENGLAGIEALSGIPGSCGAAPIQNIGAYGQELDATLLGVDFLDVGASEVVHVPASDLDFGYRTSAIKQGREGLVVAIELLLIDSSDGVVAYPQLATALGVELGDLVPISEVRASVLALRASKGMVLDAADRDTASCGSFFTNPIVAENFARSLPADAPRWAVGPEPRDAVVPLGEEPGVPERETQYLVKLSAAWLIERAGITRGFALPGSRAAISSKHTLAITNRGGATAAQVAELARYVQARVASEFGVVLHPEPNLVGVEL